MKQRIDVSPEMVTFIGNGPIDRTGWPIGSVILAIRPNEALLCVSDDPLAHDLVLVVAEAACQRIFGFVPETAGASWHLPSAIREIAMGLRDCPLAEPARATLRLAKSIELLCMIVEALREGALVPADGAGEWSELDTQRIVAARRLIDERWHEKLTLDGIARACGLNRSKLTRGFRSMFACSVNDAIAERRLGGARQMLLATDLPIASVGYRCGYFNNASFARAFGRRFGEAPSQIRAQRAAA
ncbi:MULTISPECIES: AraC family transcriptional regulator [unclassified Sphingomonas]|uniref:helix-turn-helix transcriptional regulator n=1 Tax=unclassified Sphingomonas TaxID=196159 RepID=UPI00226A6BEF|nr:MULTISPECIES: AraC family transcriptional regulator [unclassified Sphingomonas]